MENLKIEANFSICSKKLSSDKKNATDSESQKHRRLSPRTSERTAPGRARNSERSEKMYKCSTNELNGCPKIRPQTNGKRPRNKNITSDCNGSEEQGEVKQDGEQTNNVNNGNIRKLRRKDMGKRNDGRNIIITGMCNKSRIVIYTLIYTINKLNKYRQTNMHLHMKTQNVTQTSSMQSKQIKAQRRYHQSIPAHHITPQFISSSKLL